MANFLLKFVSNVKQIGLKNLKKSNAASYWFGLSGSVWHTGLVLQGGRGIIWDTFTRMYKSI